MQNINTLAGPPPASHRKDDKMPDSKSKTAWEAQNVIQVKVKINRNQDPELYSLFATAESRSGLARDLLNQAIKNLPSDTPPKK